VESVIPKGRWCRAIAARSRWGDVASRVPVAAWRGVSPLSPRQVRPLPPANARVGLTSQAAALCGSEHVLRGEGDGKEEARLPVFLEAFAGLRRQALVWHWFSCLGPVQFGFKNILSRTREGRRQGVVLSVASRRGGINGS
jgi:hypothetical protein